MEVQKSKEGILRFNLLKKILFVFVFLVFAIEIIINLLGGYNLSEQKFYPVKAVAYLSKQDLSSGNLFTLYDYGGYLIWKLPNKKVFIDGRMPSWRRTGIFNPNESGYVFKDYLKMLGDENYFKQMLKKYNIHYVLLPVPSVNTQKISWVIKFRELVQKLTLFKTNTQVIDSDLTKMNFKEIYNDGQFIVYKI